MRQPALEAFTHYIPHRFPTALLLEEVIPYHACEGVPDVFVYPKVHLDLHRGQPVGMGVQQVDDGLTHGTRSPGASSSIFL